MTFYVKILFCTHNLEQIYKVIDLRCGERFFFFSAQIVILSPIFNPSHTEKEDTRQQ